MFKKWINLKVKTLKSEKSILSVGENEHVKVKAK